MNRSWIPGWLVKAMRSAGERRPWERPVLGGGGERTAQGCNSARSVLRAGGGRVEGLAVPSLWVSGLPVATEDVVSLAAAD